MKKIGKFTILKELGKGLNGKVCLVEDPESNVYYVVKSVPLNNPNLANLDFKNLPDSDFLLKYYFCLHLKDMLHIFMENCEKGNLLDLVNKVEENDFLLIFRQLVEGIYFLHQRKIIHGNIKPTNILINYFDEIRVADYAFTKEGSVGFMPAEVLGGSKLTFSSDVFALGVSLYILATGHLPFAFEGSKRTLLDNIWLGNLIPFERTGYSNDVKLVIHQMLDKDPKKRPSLPQLLKLPILHKIFLKPRMAFPPYPFCGPLRAALTPIPSSAPTPAGHDPGREEDARMSSAATGSREHVHPQKLMALQHQTQQQQQRQQQSRIEDRHDRGSISDGRGGDDEDTDTSNSTSSGNVTSSKTETDKAEVDGFIKAIAENNPAVSYTAEAFCKEFLVVMGRRARPGEVTLFLVTQRAERNKQGNGINTGNAGGSRSGSRSPELSQSQACPRLLKGYTLTKRLGKGSFGEVHKCTKGGRDYAIKCLDDPASDDNMEQILACGVSAALASPFLVRYYETFRGAKGDVYIVMELCQKGNLSMLIQSVKQLGTQNAVLDPSRVAKILIQLLIALAHLHKNNILHRDLKPENIFCDDKDNVKIGDFGCSKQLDSASQKANTFLGTPLYEAPEVVKGDGYDSSADMWSLGVLLYEMCMLEWPFFDANRYRLQQVIIAGKYKLIPKLRYPEDIRNIIYSLLNVDAKKRPSAVFLLKLPFILEQAHALNLLQYYPEDIKPK